MRIRYFRHLSACYFSLIAWTSASAKAAESPACDLIALAPVIETSDQTCLGLEIAGRVKLNDLADLMFRAIYRVSVEQAYFINGSVDRATLLFASNRKCSSAISTRVGSGDPSPGPTEIDWEMVKMNDEKFAHAAIGWMKRGLRRPTVSPGGGGRRPAPNANPPLNRHEPPGLSIGCGGLPN